MKTFTTILLLLTFSFLIQCAEFEDAAAPTTGEEEMAPEETPLPESLPEAPTAPPASPDQPPAPDQDLDPEIVEDTTSEENVVPEGLDPACQSAFNLENFGNSLSYKLTPSVALPGQEVTVSWNLNPEIAQNLQVRYQTRVIGEGLSGEAKIVFYGTRDIAFQARTCWRTVIINKVISLPEFVKTPLKRVKSMAAGFGPDADKMWVGQARGVLGKIDSNLKYTLVAAAPEFTAHAKKIKDESDIISILDFGDDCEGVLYVGTRAGYLYRSLDRGKTYTGLNKGQAPVQYFTTNAGDAVNNPSAIQFITRDPKNEKKFYVGHSAGLVHFNDCANPDATKASYHLAHKKLTDVAVAEDTLFVIARGELFSRFGESEWIPHFKEEPTRWIASAPYLLLAGSSDFALMSGKERLVLQTGDHFQDGLIIDASTIFLATDEGVALWSYSGLDKLPGIETGVSMIAAQGSSFITALDDEGQLYLMNLMGK